MFFDRNEIHIQAFGEIPPAKLMSGDSSSSTFHDFQEFIISNYQNFRFSNLRIFNFRNSKSSNFEIPKSEKSGTQDFQQNRKCWSLIFPKSIFSKDVPWFVLVSFEVNSCEIQGSRVHYRSQKCRNFGSSKVHPKSSGIDQESIISHLGIIKTP